MSGPNTKPFAGRAFTVRFIPVREDIDTYGTMTTKPNGDNLQWQGVEQIQKGDVLVIDSRNDPAAASAGNILVTRLLARVAKAIFTDGALRDGSEIAALPLPAFAREITATTRISYHHVADLQVPIGCAGVAVYPGDIIVGDVDGLTLVPAYLAEELAEVCLEQDDIENYLAMRIAAGEPLWGVYPLSSDAVAAYKDWVGYPKHHWQGRQLIMAEHKHANTIRRYFDACNEGDFDRLVSCSRLMLFTTSQLGYLRFRSVVLKPSLLSGCGA